MWQQFIKDYFSFSRKERTGVFILLAIIIIGLLIPFLYPIFFHSARASSSTGYEKDIEKLKTTSGTVNKNASNYINTGNHSSPAPVKAELFFFDPNTASENDWARLGIPAKTCHTIMNYLLKGGHFYKPEDIKKIWGMKVQDAERLIPYIRIVSSNSQATSQVQPNLKQSANDRPQTQYVSFKKADIKPIDINLADSAILVALPGIGASYSKRIINFRNKLGGFYSINQVAETFGLPDSTFQSIKPKLFISDSLSVKKINVNTATLEELKAHPYIRYYIANAIIQYRTQHGNFSSLRDLKQIMLITDEVYNKIYHYLSLN
jgi:competence protein ComEA